MIVYPNEFASCPVDKAPIKRPTVVIELFTPRYFPSKPCGMLLKKITELAVLKIEKAITIKEAEIIATTKDPCPIVIGINKPAISTAAILGAYDNDVERSSPIFDINRGATKKIEIITAV